MLAESQKEASGRFARPLADKWAGIDFDWGHADAPLLRGVNACIECGPFACHDGGDHLLFAGRVVRFRTFAGRTPLIFCKGGYGALKPTGETASLWPLAIHYQPLGTGTSARWFRTVSPTRTEPAAVPAHPAPSDCIHRAEARARAGAGPGRRRPTPPAGEDRR